MKQQTLYIVLGALVIGGVCGYLIAQNPFSAATVTGKNATIPAGMHRMSDGTLMGNGMDQAKMGMMNGMDHGMMMVSSEREFITEMIPHHEEAVNSAKDVLARGATTPEIKSLLENIVMAQEREIADMKAWYLAWYGTPYQPSGKYQPMMREASTLEGAALDAAFLEDMVMHHMGAIMMAHSVQSYIEHDEIRVLSQAIINTQSEEIQLMRRLRAELE